MKKNRLLMILMPLITLVSLSSCNIIISINSSDGSEEQDTSVTLSMPGYAGQQITLPMLNKASDIVSLDSTGNQNILVLPICFSDFPLTTLSLNEKEVTENIRKLFFGSKDETGWESLSSYYQTSSYNKLNLSGEVAPIYTLDKTLLEICNLTGADPSYDPTYYIVNKASENFKNTYEGDITKFDQNKDGYFDAIWMVYLNPYFNNKTESRYRDWYKKDFIRWTKIKEKLSDLLWAYTYWQYDNADLANPSSPVPFVYSWASYDFMFDGDYMDEEGNHLVDGHTFIHETGHLLGLDDYYNYNYDDDGTAPIGATDMMDNNIGDHNPYSKYLLNWLTPRYVEKEGEYTLTPFTNNGDCLLMPLNSSFNDSPFDEYLMFEYYTPDKLNYLDSITAYDDGPKMIDQPGVRVYHVDSRLVKYVYSRVNGTYMFSSYTNKYINNSTEYCLIGASNTPSYNMANNQHRLISLLSNQHIKENRYYYQDREDSAANAHDLFVSGSTINDYTSNKGQKMKYQISFSELNSESVKITFSLKEENKEVK